MQLTGREAANQGLLSSLPGQDSTGVVRPASIDLHVGKILINGKEHSGSVDIKPQQMFIIVSAERVSVKPQFVGYAMPKTALCNEGILCLNTGLVDPGYEGLISTTAINFEEDSYTIAPGDAFLRLVFHRLEGEGAGTLADTGANLPDARYIKERKDHSKRFPETFLNIPGQIEAITERVLDRQTSRMVFILTIFTILFGFWNWGAYALLGRQVSDVTKSRPELDQLQQSLDSARRELRALRRELDASRVDLAQRERDADRREASRGGAGSPKKGGAP